MSSRVTHTSALLLLSLPLGAAMAGDEGLSEAQTSYTGAVMLEGDVDVTFGGLEVGDMGLEEGQERYAFFTGNTLYFGVEDESTNSVDGIAEFFWFESSIDRGSDFYVAVIKVRTTPAVGEDWYLEVGGAPVNYVRAETDTSAGVGAFRWDWSLPFENYGMDSYGEVTLTNEYGIGGNAEGSAMYAKKVEKDGASADVNVQTKGYVNTDFKVATQYQVTLFRWNTVVQGGAGYMDWAVTLENSDRDEQSAYHEYFLVMQVDEGEIFTIDRLDIGGGLNNWWWTQDTTLGIALTDIKLSQPPFEPDWNQDGEDDEDGDAEDDEDWSDREDETTDGDNNAADGEKEGDVNVSLFGCSAAPGPARSGLAIFGLLGLAMLGRRRQR
ncbi:MAG: MYXO-CTERM domain-containing protein [Myxococcota bacterium]|jgi:MYXO-CTERM domain-containing protein